LGPTRLRPCPRSTGGHGPGIIPRGSPRQPTAPVPSPGAPTLQCAAAQQPAGEILARLLRDIPTQVKVLDQWQGAEQRTISNILGAGEDSAQLQRMIAKREGGRRKSQGHNRHFTAVLSPLNAEMNILVRSMSSSKFCTK